MPQYQAPGVYVEEVERGAKPIEGVGTSTPGFLGETERGPEDPRLITSYADYQRWYGGVVEGRYLPQAVEGFFQNGGSRCYVGRVTPEVTETGAVNLPPIGATAGHLAPVTDTLDFGRQAADHPVERDVLVETVEERGDETITITGLTIRGDRRNDFEVRTDIPPGGLRVEAGDPEPITVAFTHPDGASDGPNPTLDITVAGESTADDIELVGTALGDPLGDANNDDELGYTPGQVDFGTVTVGETAEATVTVQNLGSTDITLGSPAVNLGGETAPYGVPGQGDYDGITIASGETRDVAVRAEPGEVNEWSGTLAVEDDGGNATDDIQLDVAGVFTDEMLAAEGGTAANDHTLATASEPVDFGTFVAGNTRGRTVTIYNRGDVDVTIDSVVDFTGDTDAFVIEDRAVIENGGIGIQGGESAELTIRAEPDDVDEENASVTLGFPDGAGGTGEVSFDLTATVADSIIELNAIGPGDWAEGVAVSVADGSLYNPDTNDFFRVIVRYWSDPTDRVAARAVLADPDQDIDEAPDPDAEEVYDNRTTDPASSDHYGTTLDTNSALVGFDEDESEDGTRPANGTYWLDGDFPDNDVVADDFDGDAPNPEDRTGFAAFDQVDEISMVCIPDEHEYTNPLHGKVLTHCTNNGDRFAILQSPPSPPTPGDLRPTENSDFAAFYYPWLTVGNPETGRDQDVPPGGHVAGVYARTDQERGVHKAPANEQVRGIRGLQKTVSKGDQETLNPRGVNCIRTFRGRGTRVWGARTTSSDPAWKYVNVRRLFLFVEESIEEGTQWVVFEPNNERLWARVRQTIRNFLTSVWNDGALMGTTPEEAFYVKCDRSTMTQNDIDNGRLICEIGIAPVKPAEFVVFRISQTTAGGEG